MDTAVTEARSQPQERHGHIWLDVPVLTADTVRVGTCWAVVIDPSSWKTLAAIVRRRLWERDVCVSAEAILRADPSALRLTLDRQAFRRLMSSPQPRFERPPGDWLAPLGWPHGRVFWPSGYSGPAYPRLRAGDLKRWGTLRSPVWPDRLATDGALAVVTHDGYTVGTRARLFRAAATAGRLVFQSNGVLWAEGEVQVPEMWVSLSNAWAVQLAFDRETIRRLLRSEEPGGAELAGNRIMQELARQQRDESVYDADPYDVLAQPSASGFKTAYERDDASVINPQSRPDAVRV